MSDNIPRLANVISFEEKRVTRKVSSSMILKDTHESIPLEECHATFYTTLKKKLIYIENEKQKL